MKRRGTPEADLQRAVVRSLRQILPRTAIIHHCANEVSEPGPRGAKRQAILVGMGVHAGFPEVASGLVALGYRLAAGLFTAAEVGAPHRRERLFILAIREGDKLADPARLLRHPLERRQSDGTPALLANAPRQRQREPADAPDAIAGGGQTRDEPRHDGRAMADAAGDGWRKTERGQSQIGGLDPCQPDVDDPDGAGSQGWCDDTGEHAGQRPPWPPGPLDADGWQRYLRSAPVAEPAVRRGSDGLAHRVDRLRLCGNGVVPLVAAHALRTLAYQLLDAG